VLPEQVPRAESMVQPDEIHLAGEGRLALLSNRGVGRCRGLDRIPETFPGRFL